MQSTKAESTSRIEKHIEEKLLRVFFRYARRTSDRMKERTSGTWLNEWQVQRGRTEKDEVKGAIAQLGERLPCTQEVVGSIPSGSTIILQSIIEI